jgi:hypothetical protein
MWFKYLIGLALIGVAIAFGVQKLEEKGTSSGPTVVTVNVPNPVPGGSPSGGGGEIYVP